MITNAQISRVLKEMAALYEMRDVPFRPRAYEKAAMGVEEADEELARIFEETGSSCCRVDNDGSPKEILTAKEGVERALDLKWIFSAKPAKPPIDIRLTKQPLVTVGGQTAHYTSSAVALSPNNDSNCSMHAFKVTNFV